ncbi:hypothetical protein DJ533_12110 [Acinetobacter defluvii]|uniref:Uncharacterized protein n=1 Tax=Acinetobacter defluvii TaxID=1871111 RepID=A0A2S2FE65_9GAMM|nr:MULTISPECIES: hypothetical protein [Acinetobacter]AWL29256.1 hypothetical protein DJ533_12110 [Acinetobacter defluvii]
MKQKPTKSQTTRLYQEPTAAEMRTSRLSIILANAKEFAIFALIALVFWFAITAALVAMFGG